MIAGRAALPRPLVDFCAYEFATQCPTPACRFRRFPVAPIVAARPELSVAEALVVKIRRLVPAHRSGLGD
jgi:hypothetical protein